MPTESRAAGLWTELAPKWPEAAGFWDDWLREGPQRKGRASIRPEVSRTVTFGEKGTSVGQFYKKYLAKISLNSQGYRLPSPSISLHRLPSPSLAFHRLPSTRKGIDGSQRPEGALLPRSLPRTSCCRPGLGLAHHRAHGLTHRSVDWAREDLRYLSKGQYETQFDSWVQGATVVHSLESARRQAESDRVGTDLLLRYRDQSDFVSLCKRLGLMEGATTPPCILRARAPLRHTRHPRMTGRCVILSLRVLTRISPSPVWRGADLKAGVPRTAYHGVVLVRINGRRLFLAPNYKVDQDITADGHGIKPGRRVA